MWRSYTSLSGGYCLGFDGRLLNELTIDGPIPRPLSSVGKVYYGDNLPEKLAALLQCGGHAHAEWLLENIIKHESFSEEKEWRIIITDPPASIMSFHSGHATIKASVQIRNYGGNRKLPLKEIVYGPTLRNDKALEQTLKWMLERCGYGEVELRPSPIPYRL